MAEAGSPSERVRLWPLIGESLGQLGRHFSQYVVAVVLSQALAGLVALFAVWPIFTAMLDAAGITGVTTVTALRIVGNPWSVLLLIALVLLVGSAVLVEIGTLASLAVRHRHGLPVSIRLVLRDLLRALRKTLSPAGLLLIPYLFLLLPLGGLGLASLLIRGIEIPLFISGELMKMPGGAALYYVVIAVLFWLNLRLLLTVPNLIGTDAKVRASFAASWRMTRWQGLRLASVFAVLTAVVAVFLVGTVTLGLMPTEYTDRVMPEASVLVAGLSLALIQGVVYLLTGLVLAVLAIVEVRLQAARLGGTRLRIALVAPTASTDAPARVRRRRPYRTVLLGFGAAVLLAGVTIANAGLIEGLAEEHPTAVLAHRGDVNEGVENTISSLEAAAESSPEYVEMDIQETADGGFVVIHDTDLGRLAGRSGKVYDLTEAELTGITVRADGRSDTIPSLADYIDRAKRLDQLLLVEVKPHGRESADYLVNLLALLEEKGVAEEYIVQSLDGAVIEELRELDPDIALGYVLPFTLGSLPETSADLVVVEDFSYSDRLRDEARAAGKQLYVWTVNSDALIRAYLRDGVDGIITDSTARAVELRADIAADRSVLARLRDVVPSLLAW